jgi:AcrR family transcriptional regulator
VGTEGSVAGCGLVAQGCISAVVARDTTTAAAAAATRTAARHRSRVVRGKPYDDVMMRDIAARAGVSRDLLYHYFPSKRYLYVAIFKRASDRFLARVSPDPQRPLASALEAHIQSFVDHPFEAVTINRGALSDDPAIQAIVAEELNVVGNVWLINSSRTGIRAMSPRSPLRASWRSFAQPA